MALLESCAQILQHVSSKEWIVDGQQPTALARIAEGGSNSGERTTRCIILVQDHSQTGRALLELSMSDDHDLLEASGCFDDAGEETATGELPLRFHASHSSGAPAGKNIAAHRRMLPSAPMQSLTVIIPALNEASIIGEAIESARGAGAKQIIVADGGSDDATVSIARNRGAEVVPSRNGRGAQLNVAAAAAQSEALLFLHADTRLPAQSAALVLQSLTSADFGGFRLRFAEKDFRLRVAERMINLRTSITLCPWGDQAQFIRREVFEQVGGFREIPLMEDYELAVRLKPRRRTVLLNEFVVTSGRRFLRKGLIRTSLLNWRIIHAFHRGVEPERLAELYRR